MGAALPVVHPHCSVALRLVLRKEEEGAHSLRLNIVNEDGHPVVPAMDGRLEVAIPEGTFFIAANMVINLQGLKFSSAGLHSIDVSFDGRQIASIPLHVRIGAPRWS